jgi:hypothetical protein
MLRSRAEHGVSKHEATSFETRCCAPLLRMRIKI